jgi:archaellum component FlaC
VLPELRGEKQMFHKSSKEQRFEQAQEIKLGELNDRLRHLQEEYLVLDNKAITVEGLTDEESETYDTLALEISEVNEEIDAVEDYSYTMFLMDSEFNSIDDDWEVI